MASPSGIYASTATRRQRRSRIRRRRARSLVANHGPLLAAWAPAGVLAVLCADRYLG